MTHRRLSIALLVFALPLAAGACARPVGVVRVDPQQVQRELTGNVLSAGDLSRSTRNVLFLHCLSERFDDDPEAALDVSVIQSRFSPPCLPLIAAHPCPSE